jgi:outer membrane protein TolC
MRRPKAAFAFALGLWLAAPLRAGPANIELSLGQAIDLAQRRDASVDRAKRSSKIAELQVADARANYRPNANVSASVNQSATGSTYRTQDLSFRRGLEGNFVGTVSADVSMPIDISGAIGRQVKSARLRKDLAELGYDEAKANALTNIQIAYLAALEAQETAAIDEAIAASIERLQAEAAKSLPSVLPFFEVELANARDTLASSRAASDQAKDALKLALRLPLGLDLVLTTQVPDFEASALCALDPDPSGQFSVEEAKRQVDTADLAVEQAKDPRRPSLSVGAYATQTLSGRFIDEAGRTTNRDYGLNVTFSLPLLSYDAGRNANSVRTSRLLAEQARADLETRKLSAELDVRQARAALDRAVKRLKQLPDPEAAGKALAAATQALFAAPPETAPGLLAQISNARSSWRFAQLAVIDARTGALIAALRLARALGRPLELTGKVTAHDPGLAARDSG